MSSSETSLCPAKRRAGRLDAAILALADGGGGGKSPDIRGYKGGYAVFAVLDPVTLTPVYIGATGNLRSKVRDLLKPHTRLRAGAKAVGPNLRLWLVQTAGTGRVPVIQVLEHFKNTSLCRAAASRWEMHFEDRGVRLIKDAVEPQAGL